MPFFDGANLTPYERTVRCGLASLGSPLAIAVLLLSAWRFYKPRMASEDKILEEQFGDAWQNYAAKTPARLLPFVV